MKNKCVSQFRGARFTSALLFGFVAAGCGPDGAAIRGVDDEVTEADGELCVATDVAGMTEGSPEARGVLAVANQSDAETLRAGVRLTRATSSRIVARRDGADGVRGTVDDRPFLTLAELSAVCGVGTASMRNLLAWAKSHGMVPPTPGANCIGAPTMPQTEALAITTGTAQRFNRTCDGNGTCGDWAAGPEVLVSTDNGPNSMLLFPDGALTLEMKLGFSWFVRDGSSTYECSNHDWGNGRVDPVTGLGTAQLSPGSRCAIVGGSGGPWSNGQARAVDVRVGQRCMAVIDHFDAGFTGVQSVVATTLTW